MNRILVVAHREMLIGLRNRWVLATTVLLAILALSLVFLGSAPTGRVGAGALDVVVVSLSSLTIFLVPLIALLISHDAIVGEMEGGTMSLLLTYPIGRWQVIIGKFVGHLLILAFATVIGYGAAAGALALTGTEILRDSAVAFATMIASSVLLGAVFLAIGCFVSALTRDHGTAGGIAIGVWLVLVLVYDMALLGLLVIDQGKTITPGILNVLLLLNPTDVYRLFNLAGSANVSQFAGMAGLAGSSVWSTSTLLAALTLWIAVPLGLAVTAFARREV
jgi:Cu-processing system permease protein